jgi:hypothetical protein
LASSIPATSAKVTRMLCGSIRRARERPNWPSAPIPPPAWARRAMKTKIPTSSSVGPKPSRISASADVELVGDCALIMTPCSVSSASSLDPFQNDGTCVAKSFVGVAVLDFAGYLSLTLKLPWTAAPLLVIEATLLFSTALTK